MEVVKGLLVIAFAILCMKALFWIANRHNTDVGEPTDFDQYDLPSREDFVFHLDRDLDDLVMEGACFYALAEDEVETLVAFVQDKDGWFYGDIFRAFYRAQLGIKEH